MVLLLGVALASAPVAAEPVNKQASVFGVQGGRVQSAAEADNGLDASDTFGLFFRKGFSHRWALQFDLSKTRQTDWSIVSSTASVMHAFGDSTWLVPLVRGGVGFDASNQNAAVHAEAAAVLELRLDGGLVIGVDLSVGARNGPTIACVYDGYEPEISPDSCDGESVFRSTYRAAKLTLGLAF